MCNSQSRTGLYLKFTCKHIMEPLIMDMLVQPIPSIVERLSFFQWYYHYRKFNIGVLGSGSYYIFTLPSNSLLEIPLWIVFGPGVSTYMYIHACTNVHTMYIQSVITCISVEHCMGM